MNRVVIDGIFILFGATLMAGAMSVGGPALNEYDALKDAQEAAAKRERFEREAQASCGENAAWVELPDGQTQCKTKHGRNTIKVTL